MMTQTHDEQYTKMVESPIPRLIIRLAIPTIISMLMTAFYNTADTYFVSQLGTSATGAVGVCFSLMAIIQAVGFTFGMGCASWVSRSLGEQNQNKANLYASTGFFVGVFVGFIILAIGLLKLDTFIKLLGATETILPYARSYGQYIFLGAPIMVGTFVMNNIMRSQGKAFFSMIALLIGGLSNIVLDPIFIFTLNLKTAGAAIATVISQCVSFSILLYFFLRKKTTVRLSFANVSKSIKDVYDIVRIGFPSLCRQGLASIAMICLNISAAKYGDAALAGMSVVSRIVMLAASAMIGLGQGFTPVCGYNFGAKQFARVKESYWFTVKTGGIFLTVFGVILFVFAPQCIRFFASDALVVATGIRALRFQAISLPFHALCITTNFLMQSTGKALAASFLSSTRQGIFFIPLILLLSQCFGLLGVEMAQSISDVLSALVSIPFFIGFVKKYPSNL